MRRTASTGCILYQTVAILIANHPLPSFFSNREISSSRHAALETAQLLYRFVGAAKFASIEQLIAMIKEVGTRLIAANPKGELTYRYGKRSSS